MNINKYNNKIPYNLDAHKCLKSIIKNNKKLLYELHSIFRQVKIISNDSCLWSFGQGSKKKKANNTSPNN